MGDWKSDEEIVTAADQLKDTFVWLLEDDWPASGYPRAHIEIIARDVNIIQSLDPQKLADEYARVYKAALAVGENEFAIAELRQSQRHLTNWTGLAAEEFKKQMDRMEVFCRVHKEHMFEALRCLVAMFTLAVASRTSYWELIRATQAAARNAKEDSDEEDAKLKAAVLHDIAGGVLGMEPSSLIRSGLMPLVEISKDVTEWVITGNDFDQVMADYRRRADELCESFGTGLDRIAKDLRSQMDRENQPAGIYQPLPPICDVSSPDFRYEHFQDAARNIGPIGPIVDEERRRYVDEKKAGDARVSEIERRLGHDGRGVR